MSIYPILPEIPTRGWPTNCILAWRFWLRLVPLTTDDWDRYPSDAINLLRVFVDRWSEVSPLAEAKSLPKNKVVALSTISRSSSAIVSPATSSLDAVRKGAASTLDPAFAGDIGYLDTALMPYVRVFMDYIATRRRDAFAISDFIAGALSKDINALDKLSPQELLLTPVGTHETLGASEWETRRSDKAWQVWMAWFESRLQAIATPAEEPRKVDIALASMGDRFWQQQPPVVLSQISQMLSLAEWLPSPSPPASLPPQDTGARFEWRDSKVVLGNGLKNMLGDDNALRLTRIRSLVVDSLEEFLEATPLQPGSNDPFARVRRHSRMYLEALNDDVEKIDFDQLFGVGTMLQNRLAADLDPVPESDLPPFSPRQRAALLDFQTQHGLLLVGTDAGLRALAAAERIERNPDEERAIASAIEALVDDIGSISGLASPQVLTVVREAALEMGRGKQADRAAVFGLGTARNLAIVLFAGATIAVAGMVGGLAGPAGTIVASTTAGTVIIEALKKSSAFRDLSEPLTDLMNAAKAGELLTAIKRNTAGLQQIAGNRPEMSWLRDYLTWLNDPSVGMHSDDEA